MTELLSELKKACKAVPSPTLTDTIERGKSTRLRGRPAQAPDGTIALALSDDAKVIINETEIQRVERDGEKYTVEVSAEAHFMLQIEKLFKATPNCDCHGSGHGTTLAHERGPKGPIIDIEIGPIEICDVVCGDVYINGFKFHVCVPVNCRIEKKQ